MNDDVLNFSVSVIRDLLNLDSAPNSIYGDKTIIYHLFNAAASQNSINHVNNLSTDAFAIDFVDIQYLQKQKTQNTKTFYELLILFIF
ncbi:MAG: Pseudogene of conserved hypothetical protein [Methanobrevibacter sp. CfCl-M3]